MNCRISEIKCTTMLAPSTIPLGDYVINPYRGCYMGCAYCYAQKNIAIQKRQERWGTFVDVKINGPEVLAQELRTHQPRRVLIGSTTEVYQPCEQQYQLMRRIIELLNQHAVAVTILTKSPLIQRDIDLLCMNVAAEVYVTMSPLLQPLHLVLEPRSPLFAERVHLIKSLVHNGLRAHCYINPVIPYCIDILPVLEACQGVTSLLSVEGINLRMVDFATLSHHIKKVLPESYMLLEKLVARETAWNGYWNDLRRQLDSLNQSFHYTLQTFFHSSSAYFGVLPYRL